MRVTWGDFATRLARIRFTLRSLMMLVLAAALLLGSLAVYRRHRARMQEIAAAEGDVALATSELQRAQDRLAWSNRMFSKGYVSRAQNAADQISVRHKQFQLEQSRSKLKMLEGITAR